MRHVEPGQDRGDVPYRATLDLAEFNWLYNHLLGLQDSTGDPESDRLVQRLLDCLDSARQRRREERKTFAGEI